MEHLYITLNTFLLTSIISSAGESDIAIGKRSESRHQEKINPFKVT
jgi:hypothetical protein